MFQKFGYIQCLMQCEGIKFESKYIENYKDSQSDGVEMGSKS